MAKISGILTDGAGQIINDCTIELYAKKTTSKVLTQTQAFQVANNGSYTINVLPCEYDVSLIINGFPKKRLGTIQVYSDSLDGTLNDFLLNPSESEITPSFLQQVIEERKNAQKAASEAKTWAGTIDPSNFIKKDETSQVISGSLDVKKLTENGQRVFSPNNKPSADDIGALAATRTVVNNVPTYKVGGHVVFSDKIGDQRLMPFRRDELPFGWYFRNGDNYLLSSPQGQALNSLSVNYKNDHQITIKEINGQQYINVPTAFHSDGRGYFERAVNGATRRVGHIEDDKIRNITGGFSMDGIAGSSAGVVWGGYGPFYENGTNPSIAKYAPSETGISAKMGFDASRVVPTADENRPINIGLTPTIYLGV